VSIQACIWLYTPLIKVTGYLQMVITAILVITTHPNNNGSITVAEGSDVELRCEATGNETLNYQWKREPGSVAHNARRSNGGKTLFLHNIMISDSGQYYCKVDNGGESVSSMRVQVTVKSQLLCTFFI